VVGVARLLNAEGAHYVLVGGYALAAHGFVRMTQDVDIAVAPGVENARRWVAALSRLPDGAARELAGEEDPFAGSERYAIRINDEFTVDVLPVAGGVPFEALEPHIVTLTIEGEPVRVLDLAGLLLTKQGVRPQDQADAALIRRALGRGDDRAGDPGP
jgi:hypothetical protein